MGKQSNPPILHLILRALLAAMILCLPAHPQTHATTVPLILPTGLVYDQSGNLLFAESGRHLIRSLSPTGILTTLAGTGTQGFSGDNGPALTAQLDTPTALALDPLGNLYLADTHNHRIRRITPIGIITTVATGLTPTALTIDSTGNLLYISNHQLFRLNLTTLTTTLIAGTGTQGFSGDNGPALLATLDTPTGLATSPSGTIYLADTRNHRIRAIAPAGIITTIAQANLPRGLAYTTTGALLFADGNQIRSLSSLLAGTGTQAYAGDGTPAPNAALDSPQQITLSPTGLPTLADSANGRIRQIDSAGIIHTIAGLGTTSSSTLTLAAPSVLLYGTGQALATLATSPATGSITFLDQNFITLQTLPLANNTALLPLATLPAGPHRLLATYPGDTTHTSAQSTALPIQINPAPALATPGSASILYGQPVPTLTGTLTGILPQDAAATTLNLATQAVFLSSPATYPITAALTGPSAGNYALTTSPATLTITRAPSTATLSQTLTAQIATTTTGTPTGTATLVESSTPLATAPLIAGLATFTYPLTPGTHTLTTTYPGDRNFLPATSTPILITISPTALPDFTLTPTTPATVTIPSGTSAQYGFTLTPTNGGFASPMLLTASGLPPGATATFNPSYLPPSATAQNFTLTIATPRAALSGPVLPFTFALLILFLSRKKRLPLLATLTLLLGCGDRTNPFAGQHGTITATIIITATTTQLTGATLSHSTTVTLNLNP